MTHTSLQIAATPSFSAPVTSAAPLALTLGQTPGKTAKPAKPLSPLNPSYVAPIRRGRRDPASATLRSPSPPRPRAGVLLGEGCREDAVESYGGAAVVGHVAVGRSLAALAVLDRQNTLLLLLDTAARGLVQRIAAQHDLVPRLPAFGPGVAFSPDHKASKNRTAGADKLMLALRAEGVSAAVGILFAAEPKVAANAVSIERVPAMRMCLQSKGHVLIDWEEKEGRQGFVDGFAAQAAAANFAIVHGRLMTARAMLAEARKRGEGGLNAAKMWDARVTTLSARAAAYAGLQGAAQKLAEACASLQVLPRYVPLFEQSVTSHAGTRVVRNRNAVHFFRATEASRAFFAAEDLRAGKRTMDILGLDRDVRLACMPAPRALSVAGVPY